MTSRSDAPSAPVLGLRENAGQFWLLVLVNAFVGAMVGLERAVLPVLAEAEFGIGSGVATLAFIATFGAVKAPTNLAAGRLSDRYGRRPVLIAGWLAGLPVPLLVMLAPSWTWVIVANALLGVNQGLCWSTTVLMKIDLVGPRRRGLAMGLNEFAGYVAVGVAAYASGLIAARYGLRPEPFYLGLAFAAAGLALTFLVRETTGHVRVEARAREDGDRRAAPQIERRALGQCNQAGLINNLNDGIAWGLLPPLFVSAGLGIDAVGALAAAYPLTWGVLQIATGPASDRWGRRRPIIGGMLLQGGALVGLALSRGFGPWLACLLLLGAGTALVYPTLLAAVGDVAAPARRGHAVGVYRLFRDGGYVVGALGGGFLADVTTTTTAIAVVGAVTALSGLAVALWMPETLTET